MTKAGRKVLTVNGYDLSQAVFYACCSERANGGAAVLKFMLPASMGEKVENGAEAALEGENAPLFCGYVFSVERTKNAVTATALDSMRYLTARLPIQRENETAAAFAARAVNAAGGRLAVGKTEDNGVLLGRRRFDGESLLNAVYRSISESEAAGGERLFLRDEAGKICLLRESSLFLPLVIAEDSLATEYCYCKRIGDEAANYIKAVCKDSKSGMTAAATARSDDAVEKWGLLQRVVYGGENPAQLLGAAGSALNRYCRESEKISVAARGDFSVRAGNNLTLQLPGMSGFAARVCSSVHEMRGKSHIMRLELERI